LWDYGDAGDKVEADTRGSCCSLDDVRDARKVAEHLDIPFYVVNLEEAFKREVVDYFVDSYLSGETPNPCVKCNEIMKFEILLRKAMELEADYLATGHYARLVERSDGSLSLCKGLDVDKDQSYFLFTMTKEQREKVLFPLGSLTKDRAREMAKEMGLRTFAKKDSQEICFIEDDNYGNFINENFKGKKGEIIYKDGTVVGTHDGVYRYTIGQRKGLNITDGKGPYYVTELDVKNNKVVVGCDEDLLSSGLKARGVEFPGGLPKEGDDLTVKIRYRHTGVGAKLKNFSEGTAEVVFEQPQRAVTPGQAVVFYVCDELIGGGWITEAIK
ncbi:MAG: tRNA 2-thiouridine(34) synthase MnmA, partial [Deltaproteobacteria bacterium]|nr:tRNA 2-thiouridine(34) synthase MnmA [Deltaproteobacteria bacterium]